MLLLLLPALAAQKAAACTSFAWFGSGRPLYGMNFDWYPDSEIVFDVVSGEDGRRVFTMSYILDGADPVPTVGMNSLGFFAAMQVIDTEAGSGGPEEREEMIWMPFYLGLWHFDRFSEMESYLDSIRLVQYDEIPLHLMLADARGEAVLVEPGEDGNRIVSLGDAPFIVMTNFSSYLSSGLEHTEVSGTGADRYMAAWEVLDSCSGNLDPEAALEVLKAALNRSEEFPTRASMVFDPVGSTVFIALEGDLERIWKVSLEKRTVSSITGLPEDLYYTIPDGGITAVGIGLRVEG